MNSSIRSTIAIFLFSLLPALPDIAIFYNSGIPLYRLTYQNLVITLPYVIVGLVVSYLFLRVVKGYRLNIKYFQNFTEESTRLLLTGILIIISLILLTLFPSFRNLDLLRDEQCYLRCYTTLWALSGYFPLLGAVMILSKVKGKSYFQTYPRRLSSNPTVPLSLKIVIIILLSLIFIAAITLALQGK